MPALALPRTGVLPTASPPSAAPPVPFAAPSAPVQGSPALPGSQPDGPGRSRRRLAVMAAIAFLVLAVVVGLSFLGGEDDDPVAPAPAGASAPAAEQPAGPQPGDTVEVAGRTYTAQAVQLDGSCRDHAYGQVAEFFAAADCTGLSRALWATQIEGSAVVVSVSRVRMADTATARDLQALTDTTGTGNVNDLLREGVRYTGGPEELSGAEYASAVSGPVVTIVESSWVQPGAGDGAGVDAVADSALVLETRPFPAG